MNKNNRKGYTIVIQAVMILLVISLTGCFETISNFDIDPKVMRANPYLNKIDLDNETLKDYALSLIDSCDTTDASCVLNQIYRHIVEQYQYISDPEDEEVIQSPSETMDIKVETAKILQYYLFRF